MLTYLKSLRKNEEGFTLIELMVVVLIIGVLAAIAIPVFLNLQKEGIKASIKSDVRNTVSNVYRYLASNTNADFDNLTASERGSLLIMSTPGEDYAISIRGDWKRFTVEGWAEKANDYTFHFDSQDGTYKESATPLPAPQ